MERSGIVIILLVDRNKSDHILRKKIASLYTIFHRRFNIKWRYYYVIINYICIPNINLILNIKLKMTSYTLLEYFSKF